jgi:3-dehydroquinate synthase
VHRFVIGEESEVVVGRGRARPALPVRPGREQAVIVTQAPVAAIAREVADELDAEVGAVHLIDVPDRDAAKTWEVVASLYDQLAARSLGRHDTVVGVGGGAVADVAGFVAATWLRGIESVLVPTTLLAAVDAAIGGKTGINHAGKNLVGAFWHPRRVIVDLDVLEGLPVALRREGSAEILKAGYVGDPAIVAAYQRDGIDTRLDEVVPRAIAVKVGVVSEDFRESGRRAILNFGHTIGHAVETVTGLAHGHAVSVGMVAAAEVSRVRYGFDATSLTHTLFSLGLPVASAGTSKRAVLDLVARDKKRTAGAVRMVLLREIADPVVETVTEAELDAALEAVGITPPS